MKNIIVTGGLGFIGSNLIELLISKNYRVINVDKVTYSSNFYNVKNFKKNKLYKFIKSDLNNKRKISSILKKYSPVCINSIILRSMKNLLTILLFLLFLTSPLIIQYNGPEPQFKGKVQAKEQCEEEDED